jgi:mitochondrial fission protein ELM1
MDGSTADIVLHNYQFVAKLDCKLFAIIQSMEQDFKISNDGPSLIITRGKLQITFDRIMHTKGGHLCGVKMVPRTHASKDDIVLKMTHDPAHEIEDGEPKSRKPSAYWDIKRMHVVFNHAGKEVLRQTAKAYNWMLTGKLEPYEHCKVANAKQKDTPKTM